MRHAPPRWLAPLVACLLGCPPAAGPDDDDDDDDDGAPRDLEEGSGLLDATNAAGRHGAWFLPARRSDEAIPLLVLFHATGGDGASMRDAFVGRAREAGVALVAPDSRVSPAGDFTWEVGTEVGEVTPDLEFAQEAMAEVQAMDVVVDAERVWAAGFSGGGSSAPYLASNDDRFDAFAVLHGGVVQGGIGGNRPRAWISTGAADTARTPAAAAADAAYLEGLGFEGVEVRTFPGGHELGAEELDALIGWLGTTLR